MTIPFHIPAALWIKSLTVVLFVLPWGILWGWLLPRMNSWVRIFFELFLCLPLFIPPGIMLYSIFLLPADYGLFYFYQYVPLSKFWSLAWTGFATSPFLILFIKKSVVSFDPVLTKTARNLGVGGTQAFLKINFPLVRKFWFLGLICSTLRAASEILSLGILSVILKAPGFKRDSLIMKLQNFTSEVSFALAVGFLSYLVLAFIFLAKSEKGRVV